MPASEILAREAEPDDHSLTEHSLGPVRSTAIALLAMVAPSCVSVKALAETEERYREKIEVLAAENDKQTEEIQELQNQLREDLAANVSAALSDALPRLLDQIEEARDKPYLEQQLVRLLPSALHSMEPRMTANLIDAIDRRREIDETLASDMDERLQSWRARASELLEDTVLPVVQLAGDSSVGSGVLIHRTMNPETSLWDTVSLTAWHVVRDILAESEHQEIPGTIYSADGDMEPINFKLLAYDVELDLALIATSLSSPRPIAKLPREDQLYLSKRFDPVIATGCPLGNDPIPTVGHISETKHFVDGKELWMIGAPTYIGNSGGGVFDAVQGELVGIFSRIYTHGSLRATIVPHMGLMVPMASVYEWMERAGYGNLIPSSTAESSLAKESVEKK